MSENSRYPGFTREDTLKAIVFNDEGVFLYPSQSNYDTHRPLVLLGLELSEGLVIEMGSGDSSTPLIRKYCQIANRPFHSFDSNKEWAEKTGSQYVENWQVQTSWQVPCGLLFIDQAPGQHRWRAIAEMVDKADIIVYHDSEIGGAGDYQYKRIEPLFKYSLHYNRHSGGAGCSMVSNKIDVSAYRGLSLGEFKFDES
jgi:hypothetical protein